MAKPSEALKSLAIDLYKIDAIKFGVYKTKVGLMSPIYCDMRVIISYPKLMESLSCIIVDYLSSLNQFDVICGVPYTALPIATVVSMKTKMPMVMRRKEAKDYGTKKLIEGKFNEGDSCLIVEDVVTSGSSVLETVKDLKGAGLKCSDVLVILNREQGGGDILHTKGIKMHALLSMAELITILREAGCVDDTVVKKVKDYLKTTQVTDLINKPNRLKLSYEERARFVKNRIGKKLINIMLTKKTNLCVASDILSATEILDLAEQIGPHICALKTHVDIIEDYHENFMKQLKVIANKHNFILFEDRKFSDIGETVRLQYTGGIHKISTWAEIITCHSLTGKGVLDGLSKTENEKGVFLLAETSAADNLITESYTKETIKLGLSYPELVIGFVCQNPLFIDKPGMLQLIPGVKIDATEDTLGQRYNSPEAVIVERGGDVAVVGRGITKSRDAEKAARKYKTLLWEAYTRRIESN